MGTADGYRSAVGDLRFYADALVALERIENPEDFELLFARRIMRRRDVDAVVELLFVAQQAQEVGDERAIDGEIVLA